MSNGNSHFSCHNNLFRLQIPLVKNSDHDSIKTPQKLKNTQVLKRPLLWSNNNELTITQNMDFQLVCPKNMICTQSKVGYCRFTLNLLTRRSNYF